MVQATSVGAGFREGTVEADGFKIRYLESGSGPVVLEIHGAGGLRLNRADELLAENHRIIALEMPGFGSEPNERSKSVEDLARTAVLAADQLGLDKYNLMGTSFGGKIAVAAALQAGDKLDSLLLISPGAVMPANAAPLPQDPAERMARMYAHPERFEGQQMGPPGNGMALIQRINGMARDESLINRLGEIEAATLVLFGTKDGIISPDMGRIYREKMQNCSLVFVYDAGHAIGQERPEAMAGVVADFIERHEVFVVSRNSTLINP